MTKKWPKSAETRALRIKLLERGLDMEGVAALCGVDLTTLQSQFAKSFPSRRLRLIVEDALGTPIWTKQAEFLDRQRQRSRLGYNPQLVPMDQLRRQASALKIRGRSGARRRGDLVRLFVEHFNSKDKKNENRQPD